MEIIKGQSVAVTFNSDLDLTAYEKVIYAYSYPSKVEFVPTITAEAHLISCVWTPAQTVLMPSGKFYISIKLKKDGKTSIGRLVLGSLISEKSPIITEQSSVSAAIVLQMTVDSVVSFDLKIGNDIVVNQIGSTYTILFTAQNLTDPQKAQARANIGAASSTDISGKADKIQLVSVSNVVNPLVLNVGEKYYNSTDKLIYTTVLTSGSHVIWGNNGASPSNGVLYLYGGSNYVWNGSDLVKVGDYNGLTNKPDLSLKVNSSDLFSGGLVKPSLLPSYVDDVVEVLCISGEAPTSHSLNDIYINTDYELMFPIYQWNGSAWVFLSNPEKGKIYIDLSTNFCYRWSGSLLVKVSDPNLTAVNNFMNQFLFDDNGNTIFDDNYNLIVTI